MKTADLIRKLFATFDARDRESFDALLADDFTFSSPLDDKIDKTAYFERCWPTREHHTGHEIETIFAQGDAAFVTYSCVRTDGTCFRNTEFFRVKSGLVAQVEVYFGRRPPSARRRLSFAHCWSRRAPPSVRKTRRH
jgi:ketosteroid isomerase-like protein